jgi:hypothetical protein
MKWQKLTILDFLLLMFSYAVAGSIWGGGSLHAEKQSGVSAQVELFLWIVVAGNNLAAFVVLPVQYVFRHRRSRLSGGELLWFCPVASSLLVCLGSELVPSIAWIACLLLILGSCSCVALLLICRRWIGDWGTATCHWTDVFGSVACLSVGILAVYDVVAHPVVI